MPASMPRKKGKTILVATKPSLLGEGVESLLEDKAGCQVIMVPGGDCERMVAVLEQRCPDVLVTDDATLAQYVTDYYVSFRRLPEIRVLVVDLQDNTLVVLDKKYLKLEKISDLLNVL